MGVGVVKVGRVTQTSSSPPPLYFIGAVVCRKPTCNQSVSLPDVAAHHLTRLTIYSEVRTYTSNNFTNQTIKAYLGLTYSEFKFLSALHRALRCVPQPLPANGHITWVQSFSVLLTGNVTKVMWWQPSHLMKKTLACGWNLCEKPSNPTGSKLSADCQRAPASCFLLFADYDWMKLEFWIFHQTCVLQTSNLSEEKKRKTINLALWSVRLLCAAEQIVVMMFVFSVLYCAYIGSVITLHA